MEASPLPLCERISASVGVASIAETVEVHNPYTESHDQSHDQHTTRHPPAAATTGTSDDVRVVTPAAGVGGQRLVLESDTDVTPMPDYHNMATPNLKVQHRVYVCTLAGDFFQGRMFEIRSSDSAQEKDDS